MNTKDVIYELRTRNGMSQDELAEKIFVTRQAVSRWENGDTVPSFDQHAACYSIRQTRPAVIQDGFCLPYTADCNSSFYNFVVPSK